jgi:peptidoglycan/LPS O-acetylase OafA/YrhL
MAIDITNAAESTTVVVIVLLAVYFLSLRKTERYYDLLPLSVSQELKGLAILAIIFAHISYMLVNDHKFLYPLNKGAGVGVDLFLFLSGYGLSVSMLKKPLSALEFYKRRLIKVFIPFWIVLIGLFVADAVFLDIHYPLHYMFQSLLGWFPRNSPYEEVNSPFWYITWMLLFYLLFPLLFNQKRLWLTALVLCLVANIVTLFNPLNLDTNWWHRMHTDAFSLGILLAWSLRDTKSGNNRFVGKLTKLRDELADFWRYVFMIILSLFAAYMASHNEPRDWPNISQLLNNINLVSDAHFIGQTCSLLAMTALIIVFAIKKLESRFLALFGAYSYEAYLVHWPLLARYDVFFHTLPAWLATYIWLLTFIVTGWFLQKIARSLGVWLDSKWGR